MNPEIQENRITSIIRSTCAKHGVAMRSVPSMRLGLGSAAHYDRSYGIRRRRTTALALSCAANLGLFVAWVWLATPFSASGWVAFAAWLVTIVTTIHTTRVSFDRPISQQDLDLEINHALESEGFTTGTIASRREVLAAR